ncbi:hypothetical protein D1872_320350 [compost metagenome]
MLTIGNSSRALNWMASKPCSTLWISIWMMPKVRISGIATPFCRRFIHSSDNGMRSGNLSQARQHR